MNDDGNCHKVTLIGELDNSTLDAIEAAVATVNTEISYKVEVEDWTQENPNTHFGGITFNCGGVEKKITLTTANFETNKIKADVSGTVSLSHSRKYRGFNFVGFSIDGNDLGKTPNLTDEQKNKLTNGTPLVAKFKTDGTDDVTLFYDDDDFSYRIPAIAKTGNGMLVAVSDYRHNLDDIGRDNHGTGTKRIDLVMRTSTDNGATWSETKTIAAGDNSKRGSYLRAFGDAAVAAVGEKIVVMAAAGDVQYGSGTTDNPNRMARIFSTDNGAKWTIEEMTTKMYSTETSLIPNGGSAFFGSGKLAVDPNFNGTGNARIYGALLVRIGTDGYNNFGVFSDDLGATWKILGGDNTNPVAKGDEPKVEILPNGQILLSARRGGGRVFRVFTYGDDKANGAGSWGDAAVNGCNNGGSNATNGEIICLDAKHPNGTPTKILLQSQPKGGSGQYDRYNVTIWYKEVSANETYTASSIASGWTQGLEVSPADVKSAYSAMCLQENGKIAFFFEEAPCYGDDHTKGYSMVYVPLTIEEITKENFLSPNATATATTVKIELTDTEDNKYNDELDILNKNLNIEAVAAKLIEKYPFITLGTNGELNGSDNVYTYTNTVTLPFKVSNANTTVWHNIYFPAYDNAVGYPVYMMAQEESNLIKIIAERKDYGASQYNTLAYADKLGWAIYSVNNTLTFKFKNQAKNSYIKTTTSATSAHGGENVQFTDNIDEATAFSITDGRSNTYRGEYGITSGSGCICVWSYGDDDLTYTTNNTHQGAWVKFVEAPDYQAIINALTENVAKFGAGDGKYTENDAINNIDIDALATTPLNTLNTHTETVQNVKESYREVVLTVNDDETETVPGSVSITVNGSAAETVNNKFVPANATVSILATANPGYRFVNWTRPAAQASAAARTAEARNSDVVITDNPYTVTVSEAISLEANFAPIVVTATLTDGQGNQYIVELDGFTNGITKETVAAKLKEAYPYITLGSTDQNGNVIDFGVLEANGNDAYTYTNTVELPFKVTNTTYMWHNIYWPSNTKAYDYPVYWSASSADDTYVPKETANYAYGDHPTYNTKDGNDKISWAIYNVNNGFEFIFKNKVTQKYIKVTSVAEGNAQNVEYVENFEDATAFTIEVKPAGNEYDTPAQYSLAAKVGETTGYLCSTSATGYNYATHYNSNTHQGAWIEFIEAPDYYTIIHELNNGLKEFGEGEGKYIANDTIAPIIEAMKNSGEATWNKLNEYKTVVDNIALDKWVKIELTVSNENYGTVSIAGEEVKSKFAPKNKAIELLATPASGYHFVNWTKEGAEVSTDAAYTFTVPEATEAIDLVANFEKNKPVNVVLTDNSNAGSEIKHTFRFVMDDLYGEITADIIANKLKEKYPIIVSLGTNATLTDNGADYTYENTVVLPFRVSNGRGNDAIYYNIYYPVNIDGKPNYLAASSKEHSTHAEKINDDTYIYGDNPTYNTENGNSPIGWAIYSVDGSLTFALKNQETGKFIHVTSVATSNDKNAELTDEAKATAFTIYPKTVDHINYFALAAEVEGTTGYLCSTDNNYDFATHYNSNDGAGAWARIEDPGYYSRWIDWWMGYTIWFSPGDGYCIVTDEIQTIKNAMNENAYKDILLNTFVQYGITIARADSLWPTLNITINPEIGGFTAINGEENVKTKRAPEGYQIPIKAIPAEGYHFVNWSDSTGTVLSTNVDYATSISGPKGYVTNIKANFAINIYNINVTAGEGGSAYIVSPGTTNANIEHGTEVTLTATANNGYEFVNWTKEGEEVSTDAAYTFTATADGGYTANFVEIKEVAAVRYYRIGYDFDNGGKRYYMQSVASKVANKKDALLMTQETGAASIFYYADSKLLSYDKGTYVKEDGGTRGLQAVGESGTVTITTSQSTGKSTISAPNYLHANQSGTTYFVDHCDSNPDNHAANHNFVLEEVETLPVTISSALHATFYAPVAVAFPKSVKAYVLKAADIPGIETYAWMTSLKNGIIPANTGVIIKGAEGTYYFDIVDNSVENYDKARTEAEGNVLDGTVAKTKITEDAYILANRDGKVGLYPVAKNSYLNGSDDGVRFTNNSHKAYLPVTDDWFGEKLKMGTGFRFVYDDEETTGIEEFETENTETIYDLQGRKLSEITEPGIYIVNGKKVWVK